MMNSSSYFSFFRLQARLVPCFHESVVPILSKGWETGAVIEEEVPPNSRWEVGPCSSDGSLKRR